MLRISLQRFAQYDSGKRVIVARITPHVEIFCEIFYSRIDNTRLNFTLGIPGMLQGKKF